MLCALVTFFLWVVVDVAIKLASQAALSPFMIMAVMGLVGAVSIAGVAVAKRDVAGLRPQNPRAQFVLCLCAVAITYVNVIALKHLPLTIFYIVVFMSPLAIAALSAILKHETLTPVKISCLVAGFLGVVLAIAPRDGRSGGEEIGYLAAFSSIALFAISTVTMRKMSRTGRTVTSTQFVTSVAVAVAGILGAWQTGGMPEAKVLAMMVAAGFFNILGNVLYNKALQNTSSTNVAQLHYTQIISGAFFGYMIWHEVPTWSLVTGSTLIIASGMIVATQVHRAEPEMIPPR